MLILREIDIEFSHALLCKELVLFVYITRENRAILFSILQSNVHDRSARAYLVSRERMNSSGGDFNNLAVFLAQGAIARPERAAKSSKFTQL